MSGHVLELPAHALASPLVIQVDMREQASRVPALLAAYPDLTLRFGALPSGDYVLADAVVLERKTGADFVASILDRRLFGQAARLRWAGRPRLLARARPRRVAALPAGGTDAAGDVQSV